VSDALVELVEVSKCFGKGKPALDAVSGRVFAGQITGLVGPDGAGKTTLIRMMTGLLLPDTGDVRVLGFDARREAASVQASIGYMPQRFGLYEDLTVLENLTLYADLRALPRAERAAVFGQLLQFTDLASFQARLAGKLSGGMKQKLGLACALLQKPKLLLLDEPGVGVDPISRRELWKMVGDLTREGIGVLWSTAYLDEAEQCDRVLLLNEGKLLFDGAPSELTARVEERVFKLRGVGERPRQILAEVLAAPGVIDGVIQGRALRIVTATSEQSGAEQAARVAALGRAEGEHLTVEATAPRFEDAFVDLLGGAGGATSRLAEAWPVLPASDRPLIEARGLTKRFGDFTAADDITFDIRRGEIFGLLGPNGAGKSTTFKMLCGLLKPSAGEGRVAGFDLRREAAEARGRLGYMAQKFSLYGDLSVAQNLAFFAGTYGLGGARKRAQIEAMTEIFALAPMLKSSAKDLPLGFKQRLALACAVMHEPDVLFLDEPTSGVDPLSRREFWTHINGLIERGVTVLVTTHFMDEAEYCDRISLIYRGRSIALGSPDDLKASVVEGARSEPTLEDAFIELIARSDRARTARSGLMQPVPELSHGATTRAAPDSPSRPGKPRHAAPTFTRGERLRRFRALVRKETQQLVRDPSTILIAFVLPLILLFLFGYGVSLDAGRTRIGLVLESSTPAARDLGASFRASPYFEVRVGRDRREFVDELVAGRLRGIVVIPAEFGRAGLRRGSVPELQVLVDGAEPNTAGFVQNYTRGVVANWVRVRAAGSLRAAPPIRLEPRYWFNPELTSRFFLVPGSIAIIMTLIGTLLTALVVAREWERGTMEAMMATPVTAIELLAGKLLPYFALGLGSMVLCSAIAVFLFGVPFEGSVLALFALSTAFLCPALGQGLLISAATKNQFVASQLALLSGFLPGFLLSGFLFEIGSMPRPIQWLTTIVPSRYFVPSLQTVFLVGDVWPQFARDIGSMLLIGAIFFAAAARNTRKRLA
jgi:ABC-2 type transport system ATP-binding protein